MTPLYGFLEGDTIGLLILAEETDSAVELVRKLESAARLRVAPKAAPEVVHQGRVLDPASTVREAGMRALDRFDVVERRP